MRMLAVTAVEGERTSVLDGLGPIGLAIDADTPSTRLDGVDVIVGGVGPASAAARTAITLATAEVLGSRYDRVVCLGIGGGIAARCDYGDIVVGTASVAADLGAESPAGFLSVADLGFGRNVIDPNRVLVDELMAALAGAKCGAKSGAILTVTTVTGTAVRAAELAARHPDALVEAMEGYGVAAAADATKTPFVEVRTISNPVGPRDRDGWRIPTALAALTKVAAVLGAATVAA